jgi:hypothetical protein
MDKLIAACGIDCAACPAYVATMAKDEAALAKVAENWSKMFGMPATIDAVRCHGCFATDGVQVGHCAECGIRLCSIGRKHGTCAQCADYACEKLGAMFGDCPEARTNLEALRAGK